jgi:alpha-glucosidase
MGKTAEAAPWWHGATIYQIYVRSWLDSNGDGYGDIPGVTAGLDYLSWLGVDGIWLSPTMPSQDRDWGYDVCDYYGVHPDFGTLSDLDDLIVKAADRGIRVLLDLAPNHTSCRHPWFADAASGRESLRRDFYVWADPGPHGGPPNNWLAATGDPAWQRDEASGQYYLHSFLPSQPDLNWREPAVRETFREILSFWFGRGVAGFRIDAAQLIYKDASLRDDPPAPGRDSLDAPFGLERVRSGNQPETTGLFRDWRTIAESCDPPRLLLGETWVGDRDLMAGYHGNGDALQLTMDFPFFFADFTAPALSQVVARTLAALPPGECPVWAASNHDISRFPTRWCDGDERKARLALLILAMLPGTLILYYGDEIAMRDVPVPPDLRRDQMTAGDEGRDHARTPMRWDGSESAGFSASGARPWLPYGEGSRNVAAQRDDPDSVLSLCRDLIVLRSAEHGGRVVRYRQLAGPEDVWTFQAGGLRITANLSGRPVHTGTRGPVLVSSSPGALHDGILAPWAGVVTRPAP